MMQQTSILCGQELGARLRAGAGLKPEDLADLARCIWDNCEDAMALSDADGYVIAANRSYCELYGYKADELMGRSFAVIFPPEQREWATDEYKQMFAQEGVVPSVEATVQRSDGTTRTVEAHYSFIVEGGQRTGMLSILRDITYRQLDEQERIERERRAQEARDQEKKAAQIRDQLLSIVSHDLKNPLAVIKGNVQLLMRRVTQLQDPRLSVLEAMLEKIDSTATKMNLQLDQFMDFSGLQQGRPLSLQIGDVDLVALARQLVAERKQASPALRITFKADTPELVGAWDRSRLERVLENLLSNAAKYSPENGLIDVEVTRDEIDGAAWAVLTVSDHGVGIPPDDLPYVFEWFHRAGNVSGQISGTGIGLASARYIIEQHGGSIDVSSTEGEGATFTLRLPVARPH